jgi:hypothetical protein
MLSRQAYVYAMAYMVTGNETYLQYAKDGCDWIIDNAWVESTDSWHQQLQSDGTPITGYKTAQDQSYACMGLAAYYFATRDTSVEQYILKTRDTLFNTYWDATEKIVIDEFNDALTVASSSDAVKLGWDLVSILDHVNAYMTLVQPVLSESTRRDQFLNDLDVLANAIKTNFWTDVPGQAGMIWGSMGRIDQFEVDHNDFGHCLKSYWMIHQLDKRLADNPWYNFVQDSVHHWIDIAYIEDEPGQENRWSNSYDSSFEPKTGWGSMWWISAECDQVTATLNLQNGNYTDILKETGSFWMNFVEGTDKECYTEINGDGSAPTGGWQADKTTEWKNGFHSVEHAVIMYIHGKWLEDQPLDMYFAVPTADIDTFVARPYLFDATVSGRTNVEEISIDSVPLRKVKVSFTEIY